MARIFRGAALAPGGIFFVRGFDGAEAAFRHFLPVGPDAGTAGRAEGNAPLPQDAARVAGAQAL